jgi:hypothetical protein
MQENPRIYFTGPGRPSRKHNLYVNIDTHMLTPGHFRVLRNVYRRLRKSGYPQWTARWAIYDLLHLGRHSSLAQPYGKRPSE